MREENQTQMIGRVLRINPAYPNKIAYVLVDVDFRHKDFEVYKDNEALIQADKNYFYVNRQVIYLILLLHNFQFLFIHGFKRR